MIVHNDKGIQVSGSVTMDTVNALLSGGLMLHKNQSENEVEIDFSQLDKVDSSAVSLMLLWLREAQRKAIKVRYINVPENLASLAKLYGVAELLDL